jgi:golgi phosphoprotein 3
MLTMLEEVVLVAVDEISGRLRSTREFGAAYALVGAVFFDLALAGKIDTDTETIQIIDRTPTGNATLDRVLNAMAEHPELTTVRQWIEQIFRSQQDLEGEALQSLIDKGILRHEKIKRLWIIDIERFPLVNNRPQLHVKTRLANAILTDDIPDTRDVMLVSIAEACGLLGFILSDTQLNARRQRIQTLCGLETISRKVAAAIADFITSLSQAMTLNTM